MLAAERRQLIADRALAEKHVLVSELSRLFDVTEETIRRDLERLEKEGVLTRTYGGAIASRPTNEDLPFTTRNATNQEQKAAIARQALELIQDGDTLMVDPSSTSYELFKLLGAKRGLTVITNSVQALHELGGSGHQVISTGGSLRERSFSLVGPVAENTVRKYHVDKLLMSCKAISAEKGILDSNEPECELKRRMLQQANQVILLVDHSKFDKTAFVKAAELHELDVVVTDRRPADPWPTKLAEAGVDLIYGSSERTD
jgi:DeoR/GlpR family transcriptional regulator of sugar metabolism